MVPVLIKFMIYSKIFLEMFTLQANLYPIVSIWIMDPIQLIYLT